MKVIDSSALVKYFSREEGWQKVEEHILDGVITLDLAVKEIANALWKKALKSEVEEHLVREILNDLIKARAIKIMSQDEFIIDAFELAVKHQITIYDALFIAFAKRLKLSLITSDTRQAKIAKEEGIEVLVV